MKIYESRFREAKTELELFKSFLTKRKIKFEEIVKKDEIILKGLFPKGGEFTFSFTSEGMMSLSQIRSKFGLDKINPMKGYRSILHQIQTYL